MQKHPSILPFPGLLVGGGCCFNSMCLSKGNPNIARLIYIPQMAPAFLGQ